MTRRNFFTARQSGFLFWMVDLDDCRTLVRSGTLKESLLIKETQWSSPALAEAAVNQWIEARIQEGYHENPNPVFTPPLPGPTSHSHQLPQPAAATPADLPIPVERSITLTSDYWNTVPWMVHHPIADAAPTPFSKEDCIDRLTRALGDLDAHQHRWDFPPIPFNPSRSEALFWLRVMELLRSLPVKEVPAAARSIATDGIPTIQELAGILERSHWYRPPYHFLCMAAVPASKEEFLEAVLRGDFRRAESDGARVSVLQEFLKEMLPRLSRQEVRTFRSLAGQHIRSQLTPLTAPSWIALLPDSFVIGGMLGCEEAMAALVSTIPDQHYGKEPFAFDGAGRHGIRFTVSSLGRRDRMMEENRRLGIRSRCAEHSTVWLALTEWHDLDLIAESAAFATHKSEAGSVAGPLLGVMAPEAAPVALRLIRESKAGHIGIQWLNTYPLYAIIGLTPVAAGKGKLAAAALEHLQNLRRTGHQALLENALPHLPEDLAAFLRREVMDARDDLLPELAPKEMPPALFQALQAVKPAAPPAWVTLVALPPIRVGSARLGEDSLRRLVAELKKSPAGVPGPVCRAIRQVADPLSLDAFAWDLFETWLKTGSPPKEKWAYLAVGHLGSDRLALKLTPMIREWPTLGQQKRAAQGLELLRAIGTDTALTQLHGIARKVKSMPLKKAARALMDRLAEDRGLTRAELEDRIVPDGGLDAGGTRLFDFGPRQFTVFLKPDLKPRLRDGDGRIRPDLPSPNGSDDPAMAAAAIAAWQHFRKNLTQIVRTQTARMEQALVTSRRWGIDDFRSFIVHHAILTQLARKLIWATFTRTGEITDTFRITDDRSLADLRDAPFMVPPGAMIGLAHPALMTPADITAWAATLHEYELVQPFPQLQRPVFLLPREATGLDTLTQAGSRTIPIRSLLGYCEKHSWTRLPFPDSYVANHHFKTFTGRPISAVIQYDPGVSERGEIDSMDDQVITAVFFTQGFPDAATIAEPNRLPLSEVDPVTLSEVLHDLDSLLSKATSG